MTASTTSNKNTKGARSPDMDFIKYVSDFKLPHVDVEALAASHTKTLEALSAANCTAVEGAQAVAKRHNEIVKDALTEMSELMKDLSTTEKPAERVAKQAQLVKASYEKAVSNAQELNDMIVKSNANAFAMINTRFLESLDEAAALVQKAN